jgi:hypothetical protein
MAENARTILEKVTGGCAPGIGFAKDIAGLFTANDVAHMKHVTGGKLDLSNYASVKVWAAKILQETSSGNMPPAPEPQWTAAKVSLFACWIKQGCQP